MFNVVSSALRKTTKKKDEKSTKDKAEIRLVTSGETHKNEVGIVDMPSHDELKKSFEELLNELGVPDAKKTEMLAWPDDRKWMLVSQHQDKTKEEESKKKGGKLLDTPQYYMGVLKSSTPTTSVLRALRVSLNSQGVSWTNEFLDLGGLDQLLQPLEAIDYKHKTQESAAIQAECIYSVKALMNTHAGLKAVISNTRATNQLALALVCDNVEVKCVVFSLLAALCLVPPYGHSLLVAGLDNVKETMREKQRFAHVLQGMKGMESHPLRDEYLVACMRFINSFVNTPPELDMRIRLRSEFINQSLDVYVEGIKGLSPEVDNQVNIFNDMMEEDHKELDEQFAEVDIRDPLNVAQKIDDALRTQGSHRPFFLSIMKSLYLLMRQESMATHLWGVADEVLSDVVHRKYTDDGKSATDGSRSPDTIGRRFKDSLATNTKLEELNEEVKRLRAQLGGRGSVMAGSKLNLDPGAPPSPQMGQKEDERRQKELEEKVVRMAQERMQIEETARNTEKRAVQLESALNNYRSQLEQTTVKLDALEQENAQFKKTPSGTQVTVTKEIVHVPVEKIVERIVEKVVEKIVYVDRPVPTPALASDPAHAEEHKQDEHGKDEAATAAAAPPPPPPPAPPGPPPPPPPKAPPGPPGPPPPPGGKGPPPPPGGKAPPVPAQPAKVGPVPKVKMVQYNWKKTANQPVVAEGAAASPSFWNNAADRTLDIKSEFGNLEDLFGAKKAATPQLKMELGAMSPETKAKAATAVTLLDNKRVQTLSILLSRMKQSNEEIRAAILSLDANKISIDELKTLAKNAPTAEEIEMLKSYPDDPSTLGKPEQFYLAIMDIPRLQAKLEAFLFTQNFSSQVEELKPNIDTLAQACTQLKGSKKFAKVLELVLALGNFVNGGTFRGGFYGFKLDSLLGLQDVKSTTDPKLSLLHYFGRLLREKYPDMLNFADELPALEAAKRISLQTMASEVGTLRKELRAATQEAEESKTEKGNVSKVVGAALARITPEFEKLDAQFTAAQKAFLDLVTFFGDEKTITPEEFFSIVTKFAAQLDHVHKDAANEKERAEREVKRAAQAAQRVAATGRAKAGTSGSPPSVRVIGGHPNAPLSPQLEAAPGATNIMDNLISDLKSDTIKDAIKAQRAKVGGAMPPNPMVASEAMNVVLRKTGGPNAAAKS